MKGEFTCFGDFTSCITCIYFIFTYLRALCYAEKHVSFSKRVFTALGLGIVFGFALQLIYGPTSNIVIQTADWFNIAEGRICQIASNGCHASCLYFDSRCIYKAETDKNLGKISGLIIGILVATTAVAAAVGIASALSFDLQAIQVDQGSTELQGAGASAEIRGYDSENAAAADC